MAGASLRNCVQRRNHKERSQLGHRAFRGLLEKKKDYKLRAADYHRKEDAIKLLKRKATLRNPDEYYRAMNSAKVIKGKHSSLTAQMNGVMDVETVSALKTQDARYIAAKRTANARKLKTLRENTHIVEDSVLNLDMSSSPASSSSSSSFGTTPKHTVFVDSDNDLKTFNASKHFNTPAQLLNRTYNRPNDRAIADMAAMEQRRIEIQTARAEEAAKKLLLAKKRQTGGSETAMVDEREINEIKKKTQKMVQTETVWEDENNRKMIEKEKQQKLREMISRKERENKMRRLEQEMEIQRNLMGKGSKKKVGTDSNTGLPIWKWKSERKR